MFGEKRHSPSYDVEVVLDAMENFGPIRRALSMSYCGAKSEAAEASGQWHLLSIAFSGEAAAAGSPQRKLWDECLNKTKAANAVKAGFGYSATAIAASIFRFQRSIGLRPRLSAASAIAAEVSAIELAIYVKTKESRSKKPLPGNK